MSMLVLLMVENPPAAVTPSPVLNSSKFSLNNVVAFMDTGTIHSAEKARNLQTDSDGGNRSMKEVYSAVGL